MAIDPNGEVVRLREHVERVIAERHLLYTERFEHERQARKDGMEAQEKLTAAAFSSSEKAIVKAEDAQREYNIRSNEFRGQLDDQNKLMMRREEALTLIRNAEEKMEAMKTYLEARMEAARVNTDKELASLRESRSEGAGKSGGMKDVWGYVVAVLGLIIAAIAIFK